MDKEFEEKYHKLEEDNWWFRGRRSLILNLFKKYNIDKNAKILDIGCSGGALLKDLRQDGFSDLYGADISAEAVALAKNRGINNVFQADAIKIPGENESYDVLIASDVVEHIADDAAALQEWKRLLKNGGKLFIFAPAFKFLWSSHDEANHHFRRYSKKEFLRVLENTGLAVQKISYWNFALFFPIALIRLAARLLNKNTGQAKEGQLSGLPRLLNAALFRLLQAENYLLNSFNFPFGVSVFAVAEKKI